MFDCVLPTRTRATAGFHARATSRSATRATATTPPPGRALHLLHLPAFHARLPLSLQKANEILGASSTRFTTSLLQQLMRELRAAIEQEVSR